MNFTREPIIETIISPKDGYKLCVRSSKAAQSEEYFVDAVEIVSFGNSLFYRSQERPKPFLFPVSDYEVFEAKETRVALKNVSHEKNIKIGGGREASLRVHREPIPEKQPEEAVSSEDKTEVVESAVEVPGGPKNDRKRDRRRHRRRRSSDDRRDWNDKDKPQQDGSVVTEEGAGESDETKVPSPMFTHLFPPPPNLISEKLARQKDKENAEGNVFPDSLKERQNPPEHSDFAREERKEEGFSMPIGESPDDKHFFS